MSAELRKIADDLVVRGFTQGGIVVRAVADGLMETGLIPPHLDQSKNGLRKQGRKFGPAIIDIDPVRIKKLRMGINLSQRVLAENASLSPSFVHTIERGRHAGISEESADRLSRALGVDREDILRQRMEEET